MGEKKVAVQKRRRRRQIRLRRRKKKSLLNLLRSWMKQNWLWLQNPKAKIRSMHFLKGEVTSCLSWHYVTWLPHLSLINVLQSLSDRYLCEHCDGGDFWTARYVCFRTFQSVMHGLCMYISLSHIFILN